MAVGAVFVVLVLISLVFGPSVVLGDLRSWFCGTCIVCQICPSCEPHSTISPKCECHENLNNCNCVTHQNLHRYHQQWNSQLLSNQHNIHAAQQNTSQIKRHLLIWIIGIVVFLVILLFFVMLLIIFTPTLLRRCSKWKLTSTVKRRQHFMQKHNLIEQPSPIAIVGDVQFHQLEASHITQQSIPYSDPLNKLDHQQQLILKYQQELQSTRPSRKSLPLATQPSII